MTAPARRARSEPTDPHVRYRSRLQAAADPARWERLLGPGWTRHAARFEPWQQPWATLVLERRATPVADVPSPSSWMRVSIYDDGHQPPCSIASELGPLEVVPLGRDGALPGLPVILARHPQLEIVRYRPGRRCTLRLAGAAQESSGPAFVKLFDAPSAAERIHREAQRLWAASERGELPFAVARPGDHDVDLQAVWQHRVAGTPVAAALHGEAATALCRRMGAALGALAVAGVQAETRLDAAAQIARTGRAVAKASHCCAEVAERLGAHWAALQRAHASSGPATVGVVHGSPHLHQWLDDGERLGLVDFDRLGHGDLELDAATFIAELDFERGSRDRVDELTAALCEGYRHAGLALNLPLLQLYRRHKWMAKIGRTAGALRADGDERVLQLLDRLDALVRATP